MEITIIILSFLIGVAYLVLLRSFDRYEKDSLLKLIISFIIGGLVSVLITTVLYTNVKVEETFIDAIVKVGVIEEISKMCGFLIVLLLFRKSINEIVDGLIYMSAVALGFACIENVFYALSSSDPIMLLFQRSIYAVAGHLSFAGYMGIALFIHFKIRRNIIGVVLSFFLAALAHGLYDGVLFEQSLNDLFHYLFLIIVIAHIFLYRIVLSFSAFRPEFSQELFTISEDTKTQYCINCERERQFLDLQYARISTSKCKNCGSYNFDKSEWRRFIKFFRPIINSKRYINFLSREFTARKPLELDSGGGILFDSEINQFSGLEDALRIWVDHHNIADQTKLLNIPFIGTLLKYLGLRHLQQNHS